MANKSLNQFCTTYITFIQQSTKDKQSNLYNIRGMAVIITTHHNFQFFTKKLISCELLINDPF